MARASRISNYRAQAKKIPGVAEKGVVAVREWAEEKEERRKVRLIKEEGGAGEGMEDCD